MKNICIQETIIIRLILTLFRKTRPHVNLICARDLIENQHFVRGQLQKTRNSVNSKLEPAI